MDPSAGGPTRPGGRVISPTVRWEKPTQADLLTRVLRDREREGERKAPAGVGGL